MAQRRYSRRRRRLNPRLEIFGVLLTMFDGRTNFSMQVAEEVRRHFPGKVFAAVIPRNVRLAEAPSHGIPVHVYDKHSRGANAYQLLAKRLNIPFADTAGWGVKLTFDGVHFSENGHHTFAQKILGELIQRKEQNLCG